MGWTPLHAASFSGDVPVVEVLHKANADSNATDMVRRIRMMSYGYFCGLVERRTDGPVSVVR
jgi:hypothetical protein